MMKIREEEMRIGNRHRRMSLHSAVVQLALFPSFFLPSIPGLIHLPTDIMEGI